MWKIVVAFVIFAALAMYMLSQGGAIDMGGEQHGAPASEPAPAAAPAPASPAR